MAELPAILLGVSLVEGFVLDRFPQLFGEPVPPPPGREWLQLALLATLAVTPAAALAWLLLQRLLLPARLPELMALVVVAVAGSAALLLARVASAARPAWRGTAHRHRGRFVFMCVAATLTAVAAGPGASAGAAALRGGVTAGSLALLCLVFSSVRLRLAEADLPVAWRGATIGLVTAGILAVGLSGLTGIWPG